MKKHLGIILGLLGGIAPAAMADTAAPTAQQAPSEEQLMAMERDAHSGLILITAMVNEVPMRMMLDTGATHTILHKDSAAKLQNVMWLNTDNVVFSSNSSQRPRMLITTLQAGPGLSPRHLFAVMDLSAVHRMMSEKIDGIIGMDVLGSLPFTFDFRKGEFYWGIPENTAMAPLYGTMERGGRMMVAAKNGGKVIKLLLDTGSVITRVPADAWSEGSAGEIAARLGNVDTTKNVTVEEGKPGELEVAPGVTLKGVQPLLNKGNESRLLGIDALKESTLLHLPTEDSNYGKFFLVP